MTRAESWVCPVTLLTHQRNPTYINIHLYQYQKYYVSYPAYRHLGHDKR